MEDLLSIFNLVSSGESMSPFLAVAILILAGLFGGWVANS